MLGAEISAAEFAQERTAKASGEYLVTDTVNKISAGGLTQNLFELRLGRESFKVQVEPKSNETVTYTDSALTVAEKRSSHVHYSANSSNNKSTIAEVGATL